eukprot:GDKJ01050224.1.p1 GENE.GDKJ01050224.1~~GDKJ01050224.1.p1  ORF type:complete len:774 (+),score=325.12 GDKJ01050224.1:44-2365(+)
MEGRTEIDVFRNVAHSTDPVARQRAIKKIGKMLSKQQDATLLTYLKYWKPLWMAFWHSDKRAVQQEVAVNLCKLRRDIPSDLQCDWMSAFFIMMQSEFHNLDRIRMDKYLLWIRIFVAEIVQWLIEDNFSEERLDRLVFLLATAGPFRGMLKSNPFPKFDLIDALPRKFVPSAGGYIGLTVHFLKVLREEISFALTPPEFPPNFEPSEEDIEALAQETERLTALRAPVLDALLPIVAHIAGECEFEPVVEEAGHFIDNLITEFHEEAPLNEICSLCFTLGANADTLEFNRKVAYDLVGQCESLGGKVDQETLKAVQAALKLPTPAGHKKARMELEKETGVTMNRRERAAAFREAREKALHGETNDDEAPMLVDADGENGGEEFSEEQKRAMKALMEKFGSAGGDVEDDEDEEDDDDDDDLGSDFDSDLLDDEDGVEDDSMEDDDDDEDDDEEEEEEEEDVQAAVVAAAPPSKRAAKVVRNSIEVTKNRMEAAKILEAEAKAKGKESAAAAAAEAVAPPSPSTPSKKNKDESSTKASPSVAAERTAASPSQKTLPAVISKETPSKRKAAEADAPVSPAAAPSPVESKKNKKTAPEPVLEKKPVEGVVCATTADKGEIQITPTGTRVSSKKLSLKTNFSIMKFSNKKPASTCRRSGAVVAPPLKCDMTGSIRPAYRQPTPLSTNDNEKFEVDKNSKSMVDLVKASLEQKKLEAELMEKRAQQAARLRELSHLLDKKANNHVGGSKSASSAKGSSPNSIKEAKKQKMLAKIPADDE